jgi:hypothetical protein
MMLCCGWCAYLQLSPEDQIRFPGLQELFDQANERCAKTSDEDDANLLLEPLTVCLRIVRNPRSAVTTLWVLMTRCLFCYFTFTLCEHMCE